MEIFDMYLGSVLKSVKDGMLVMTNEDGEEFIVSWGYNLEAGKHASIALTVDGISVPETETESYE